MFRGLALLGLLLAACSDLPPITSNVCGNGILEPLEDCDNAKASCVQCRIQCTSVTDCPNGYRCGADDQCHAASGMFKSEPQTTVPFPVLGFRVTDVDHDGYGDVVGLNPTAMAIRYGDPGAKLSRSADIVTPQVLGNPTLAHFEAETIDDVILPTADGLVVYTGAFGVPSPRQFPLGGQNNGENAGGRPDPSDAVQVDDNIGALGPAGPSSTVLAFSLMKMEATGPAFDAPTTSLCGQTMTAAAHQDHASYRNASGAFIVFGNTDATLTTAYQCVLWVHKLPAPIVRGQPGCPSFPGASSTCEYDVVSLTSSSFAPVTTRPVFADLDGDLCPSMYVASPTGTTGIVEYKGVDSDSGAGVNCTMASTPVAAPFSLDEPAGSILIGAVSLSITPAPPPVAGRDPLQPEALVTAWGIYGITNGATTAQTAVPLYQSDRPMERAAIGDVDGDGGVDVVLSTSQPNLDIARRVPGTENFLLVRTPTTGGIVRALFGDFDGDSRDDLAYVENLGSAQRLSIAYGTSSGLEPGIPADRFAYVGFMAKMQVKDSTDPYELVDDLMVIDFVGGENAPPEITLLHGSPTRTMLSFYGPPVPVPNTAFRAVIAGDFVDDGDSAGVDDLFAIQTGAMYPGAAMWVIAGLPNARLGGAAFDPTTKMLPIAGEVGACADGPTSAFCAGYCALVDWPVVVEGTEAETHDIVLGVDYRFGDHPAFMRVDPAAPTQVTIINDLFPAAGFVNDTTAVDLDGDTIPELVVSFNETAAGDGRGHVYVCRMQRDGTPLGCDDVATYILGRPDIECVYSVHGHFHPVCPADRDAMGLPLDGLSVVCRDGDTSLVVPIRAVDGAFTGDASQPLVKVQGTSFTQAQLGDVSGDQVEDVVALDGSRGIPAMNVFRQLPTIETNVCYPAH